MALHALKIVKEELDRFRKGLTTPDLYLQGYLDGLEARIIERIEKECIEQVDPIEREARAIVGGTFLLSAGPGEYFSSKEAAQAYLDGEIGITSRHPENARPYDDPDLTTVGQELIPDGLFDEPACWPERSSSDDNEARDLVRSQHASYGDDDIPF